jgi:hypothetical protein
MDRGEDPGNGEMETSGTETSIEPRGVLCVGNRVLAQSAKKRERGKLQVKERGG